MVRRITTFKNQHRWLDNHPEEAKQLCFRQVPHRTTLSRHFKSLYPTLQDFIAFLGVWASALSPEFDRLALIEEGGLFKAHGQSGINRIAMQVAYPRNCGTKSLRSFLGLFCQVSPKSRSVRVARRSNKAGAHSSWGKHTSLCRWHHTARDGITFSSTYGTTGIGPELPIGRSGGFDQQIK
jgi:hypothetical protein